MINLNRCITEETCVNTSLTFKRLKRPCWCLSVYLWWSIIRTFLIHVQQFTFTLADKSISIFACCSYSTEQCRYSSGRTWTWSYLGLRGQAADLNRLGRSRDGDRGGVGHLGGAGEAGGGSGDRRGDDDARQRGGAGLTAGLSVNDADLVNGSRRGQRGRQLGGQHDGPLEQLGGCHHGRRRGRGDGDVGGCGRFWPDLVTTNSQSGNNTKNDPTLLGNATVELWLLYY